jgi:NADPH2:quinone reductase
MKALLSKSVGGPETLVLEDLTLPRPGTGQVLLSVKACGVNFPDTLIIEDRYQFKPARPFSPGGEVSGVVAAIGDGVTKCKPGDRIIGWLNWGGMAETIVLEEEQCIQIPEIMPFDEASAFIMTYGTSYHALKERAHLKSGETLLVLGAAGGVGLAAVELGKAMGARVIAAASSPEKVAEAKKRGADDTLVYPRILMGATGGKQLADLFKSACGENGADVIYDAVGGEYSEAALRAIAWEGRFLVVGFPAGVARIALNLPLLKSCQIVGVFWAAWTKRDPAAFEASTRELFEFYEMGAIKPLISERFPLEKAPDAIRWLAERKAVGKVVITFD